jgi:hypothetical protein
MAARSPQPLTEADADADADLRHNYSTTNRWRKRSVKWSQWMEEFVSGEDFDLNSLQLLTGDELFLTIDNKSQLGKALVAFETDIGQCKRDVAECRLKTEQYRLKIEQLETEKNDLAAQLESLSGSPNGQNLMAQQMRMLVEHIASTREIIASNRMLIPLLIERVRAIATDVDTLIRSISRAHIEMRHMFSYVKAKTNESLLTVTSSLTSGLQSFDPRMDLKRTPSPSEFEAFFLVSNDTSFTKELIGLVSKEEATDLLLLQKFVVDIFEKATKTDDAAMVNATTSAILDWKSGALVDEDAKYARPPTDRDSEVTADQPILQAVICRIIGILASSNNSAVLHEQEDGATTEQSVAGSNAGNTKRRRIDITVPPPEEYLALVLPTMMEKMIEIKPARIEAGKFNKALQQGRSQIVGHLGKRLLPAFDFGGAGKNEGALGVSLTHLSIEVINMTLTGVGTKAVSLDMITTGCVPLLGKASLSDAQIKEFGSIDTNGFVLLAGALKHRSSQEFDPADISSLTQVGPIEEDLTKIEYLGSGGFSNVVCLVGTPGEFMKMPKVAALAKILEQEAEILRKLQSGDGLGSIIPRLVLGTEEGASGISTLQNVVRGEISIMRGLRLRGVVGVPLDRLPLQFWSLFSKAIITTVYEALQFAHRKTIFHLDVRPGNIIVDVSSVPCHVMLSDWGCSVDGTTHTTLKNFRGCMPYAHDRLLGEAFTGRLDKDLDFASLTYTVHHVCAGKLKWSFPFDDPSNVSTEDLEHRRKMVCDWLSEEEKKDEAHILVPPLILPVLRDACLFATE